MKNRINVAKLLHDCPSGMELDCVMYEDVYFDYVDELNIIHCYIQNERFKTSITFNQHGTPNSDVKSKCVIFPKDKTTWEGFQRPFKDGDIIHICNNYGDATYVAILKQIEKEEEIKIHCFYNFEHDYIGTHDFLGNDYNIVQNPSASTYRGLKYRFYATRYTNSYSRFYYNTDTSTWS